MRLLTFLSFSTLLCGYGSSHCQLPAPQDEGRLYSIEVSEALQRVRWNGGAIPTATRFALAISGLSWRPTVGGISLIETTGRTTDYSSYETRLAGFHASQSRGIEKAALTYAFSFLLAPGPGGEIPRDVQSHLDRRRDDVVRGLNGVVQCPEKLSELYQYSYAAMDQLLLRVRPDMLPFLFATSESDDPVLRSRALIGLGLLGYRHESRTWSRTLDQFALPVRQWDISAVQEKMILQAVLDATDDPHPDVRAASAAACGLIGDRLCLKPLEKLAEDRAYQSVRVDGKSFRVVFPARIWANRALKRLGRRAEERPLIVDEREMKRITRGGQEIGNKTADRNGIRPSPFRILEVD